jgi:hypothetical protein
LALEYKKVRAKFIIEKNFQGFENEKYNNTVGRVFNYKISHIDS